MDISEEGLLSLKWNNHNSTFQYILAKLRDKPFHSDVTLACNGNLYPAHKLVLSSCSSYFASMLDSTRCHYPVIVLKDISKEDLESLLDYMYIGEVDVKQSSLSSLIKAAECLQIKGLAGPDEDPSQCFVKEKRISNEVSSPPPKRRKTDDSYNNDQNAYNNREFSSPDMSRDKSPSYSKNNSKYKNVNNESKNMLPSDMIKVEMEDQITEVSNNDSVNSLALNQDSLQNSDIFLEKSEPDDPGPSQLNDDSGDINQTSYIEDDKPLRPSSDDGALCHNVGDEVNLLRDNTSAIHLSSLVDNLGSLGNFSSFAAAAAASGSSVGSRMLPSISQVLSNRARVPLPLLQSPPLPVDTNNSSVMLGVTSPGSGRESITGSSSGRRSSGGGSVGSAEEPLFCPYCGKLCKRRDHLRLHIRIHTGEKPFQCPYCSRRTNQKNNLKLHIRNVHPGLPYDV